MGATEAEFAATAPASEVAKTATYPHAYAASNGFLTLLSDGERLTGAYALAVHLMTNTAVTGATYDIDGGEQLIPASSG